METKPAPKVLMCPACDTDGTEFWKRANDFTMLKCRHCGLIFVKPDEITKELLQAFYNSDYFSGQKDCPGSGCFGYLDYHDDSETLERNMEELLKKIPLKAKTGSPLRLLDIGCAYGHFVKAASKKSFEAYGIDIFPEGIQNAKEEIKPAHLFLGEIEDAPYSDGMFDVISIIGTIEHLQDPLATLKQCHRLLRDNGVLLVTTLHIDGLLGKVQWKPPEHLHYFTRRSIELLYGRAGFADPPEWSTYFKRFRVSEFLRMAETLLPFSIKWFRNLSLWKRLTMIFPTNEVLILARKGSG